MKLIEVEQILKNIPDELYEIPQYGKLHSIIQIQRNYLALRIMLYTGTVIATVQIFEDLDFICRFYNEDELINYLKTPIKKVVARISAYLSIFGFNDITLIL